MLLYQFFFKFGDSQVEAIFKNQKVFRDEATDTTQRHDCFKTSHTSMENEIVTSQMKTLMMQDYQIMIKEIANKMGITSGSLQSINEGEFGLHKNLTKSLT